MQIKIAQRYRPFTHSPGAYALLPGTCLRFQIFPALIEVADLSSTQPVPLLDIRISIEGPVENFTVEQDLEKQHILVWGSTQNGFMRYKIVVDELERVVLQWEKTPINCPSQTIVIKDKVHKPLMSQERLSLGSHKKQCWEKIKKNNSMDEILPLWLSLGDLTPHLSLPKQGTACLLDRCGQAIKGQDIGNLSKFFREAYLAGFDEGLSPNLIDAKHQGFNLSLPRSDIPSSSLLLLTEGASLIRSLFMQWKDHHCHILPALPVEFHCGRFLQVRCGGLFKIDIEWSKKLIRRMIVYPLMDAEVIFHFQKEMKRFRLRKEAENKGRTFDCNVPIMLEANQRLFFDRFEK